MARGCLFKFAGAVMRQLRAVRRPDEPLRLCLCAYALWTSMNTLGYSTFSRRKPMMALY